MNEDTKFGLAVCFSLLMGGGITHAILGDELEAVKRENLNMKHEYSGLRFSCPAGSVKLATSADGKSWTQRCITAGRVKTL
jgi:hypothetical protein